MRIRFAPLPAPANAFANNSKDSGDDAAAEAARKKKSEQLERARNELMSMMSPDSSAAVFSPTTAAVFSAQNGSGMQFANAASPVLPMPADAALPITAEAQMAMGSPALSDAPIAAGGHNPVASQVASILSQAASFAGSPRTTAVFPTGEASGTLSPTTAQAFPAQVLAQLQLLASSNAALGGSSTVTVVRKAPRADFVLSGINKCEPTSELQRWREVMKAMDDAEKENSNTHNKTQDKSNTQGSRVRTTTQNNDAVSQLPSGGGLGSRSASASASACTGEITDRGTSCSVDAMNQSGVDSRAAGRSLTPEMTITIAETGTLTSDCELMRSDQAPEVHPGTSHCRANPPCQPRHQRILQHLPFRREHNWWRFQRKC